jgi:solute carrier family 25 phosphate transporter 3
MAFSRSFGVPHNMMMAAMDKNSSAPRGKVMAASSAEKVYDLNYFLKGALAGGICCAVTHGALCPVDVVKTRIQLDPVTYNRGLIGGFKQVIAAEGPGGLLTGLGPTVVGYFVQGTLRLDNNFYT